MRALIAEMITEIEAYLGSLAASAGLRNPEQVGVELRLLCGGFLTASAAIGDGELQGPALRAAARAIIAAAR